MSRKICGYVFGDSGWRSALSSAIAASGIELKKAGIALVTTSRYFVPEGSSGLSAARRAAQVSVAPGVYLPKTATTVSRPSSHILWYSGYLATVLTVLTAAFAVATTTSAAASVQPDHRGR